MALTPVDLSLGSRPLAGVITTVIASFIAIAAVGLRLWGRRVAGVRFALDDYLVIASLVFTIGLNITNILGFVYGGCGLPLGQWTPDNVVVLAKLVIPLLNIWIIALTLIKCSLICFYIRLFRVHKRFAMIANCLQVFNILFCTATFIESFLECTPFAFNWDPYIPGGHCLNREITYKATSGINLVSDLATLLLPLPIIWKLQMPKGRKFVLSLLFALGLLVCVITILRLYYLDKIDPENLPPTFFLTCIWITWEPVCATICACAPTMRPLFKKYFPNLPSVTRSRFTQRATYKSRGYRGDSNSTTKERDAEGVELKKPTKSWGPVRVDTKIAVNVTDNRDWAAQNDLLGYGQTRRTDGRDYMLMERT
ncbi:hypothetical protein MMC25_007563 [Agyrium rufum]|nr:hypothetical protein [Agyrium rufum]